VTAVIVNCKTSILLSAQKSQFAWDTDQASRGAMCVEHP